MLVHVTVNVRLVVMYIDSTGSIIVMRAEIEQERARLLASKDLAEGERNQAQSALEEREKQLLKAQEQQLDLEKKLNELNSQVFFFFCGGWGNNNYFNLPIFACKVIHGGVNLLEQAEEQERLLESSAKELEKRLVREDKLKEQLQKKEAEKLDIEEKYANLQEEAVGKTRLLKEVWKEFQQAREEVCSCS